MISHLAKVKYTKNEDLVAEFVESTLAKYDENGDDQLSFDVFALAARGKDEVMNFFLLALSEVEK